MAHNFSCARSLVDGVGIVTAAGELDLATVPLFRQALLDAVASARSVVIDLTQLTSCDSAGLGALAAGLRSAHGRSSIHIVGATGEVDRVLTISGMDQLFKRHESRAAALDDISSGLGLVGGSPGLA